MDLATNFNSFQQRVTSALLSTTKSASQIAAEDLSFHRSSSKAVSQTLDAQNARLLALTNRMLKAVTAGSDVRGPKLQDQESVEDNWRDIVDVVDDLLEQADASLDEFTGVIKRLSPARQERQEALANKKSTKKFPSPYATTQIPKPQLLFEKVHSNYETTSFKPLLKSKPHAIKPLEQVLASDSLLDGSSGYPHPYQTEIEHVRFLPKTYEKSPPIGYLPFDETAAVFVDTEEGVLSMLEELKTVDEIAVDLEHHDIHSYIGLVSLMQISTRDKDWIVDTLKPWRENLQVLNQVFADPKILKVFHGSSMDMIWLQRDLGLYVVNLFDTFHAAMALNLPRKSLQHLLHQFAGVDVSKQHQLSDWRIRPLPSEMLKYARSDTHYLLHVYDQVRNLLIDHSTPEHNLIDYVLQQSKREALQKYERPIYDADGGLGAGGWYGPLERTSTLLNNQQFAVFRAVHQWRDTVARSEDEGPPYIMNQLTLFNVAQSMPSNRSALFNAMTNITRFIKDRSDELLKVIYRAKESGVSGPAVRDVIRMREPKQHLRASAVPERTPRSTSLAEAVGSLSVLSEAEEGKCSVTRSLVSQFWGQTLQQSVRRVDAAYSVTAAIEAHQNILPLSHKFEATFDPLEISTMALVESSGKPPVEAQETHEDEKSDIFVAKQLARPPKRKSGALGDGVDRSPHEGANGNHEMYVASNSDEVDPNTLSKAERKVMRRERKQRKREQDSNHLAGTNSDVGADTVPFDYTAAESVLHSKPAVSDKVGAKKIFDPYAKALDAPNGKRRERKEVAGKSFTFKQ